MTRRLPSGILLPDFVPAQRGEMGIRASDGGLIYHNGTKVITLFPFPRQIFLWGSGTNAGVALTASAAANTEIFPTGKNAREVVDLADVTECRLTCMVTANGGTPGSSIKLVGIAKASEAATWPTATDVDSGANIVLGAGTVGVVRDSGWVAMAGGMKIDGCSINVLVNVAFGSTPPSISWLSAWFR